MSAYVVEDRTINDVVNWIRQNRSCPTYDWAIRQITKAGYVVDNELGMKRLAEEMFTLNCDAVEQRYGEGQAREFRPLDFTYRSACGVVSMWQMLKSLACWIYQCSEGDVPQSSSLYKLMDDFRKTVALDYVENQPQYENAKWD